MTNEVHVVNDEVRNGKNWKNLLKVKQVLCISLFKKESLIDLFSIRAGWLAAAARDYLDNLF